MVWARGMAPGINEHIPLVYRGVMYVANPTAGDLILEGDMNRRFRAFDADSGKVLWETILGGIIQSSTITYSVKGKQYVAVLTGDGGAGIGLPLQIVPELKPPRGHNAIYVFALP